jgi:hypothetical protein
MSRLRSSASVYASFLGLNPSKIEVHDTDMGGRLDRCIIHANPKTRVFWYIRLELETKAKYPRADRRMLQATIDWMSGLYSHGKLQ